MPDRVRGGERRSFEAAKAAVDADLAAFKRDVARQLAARPPQAAGARDHEGVLERHAPLCSCAHLRQDVLCLLLVSACRS